MIQRVLKNLAYLYYPKNICSWTEQKKYLASDEYKRLRSLIDSFDTNESQQLRKTLTNEFNKDSALKDFRDFSKLDHWEDRCLTFLLTLVKDGELKSINLYVSILIPYYAIKVITHQPQLLFTPLQMEELQRNNSETRKIDELVIAVEKIVENKLSYQKFPKELMNVVIEDITFQDSNLGHFKMFTAFFNNQSVPE